MDNPMENPMAGYSSQGRKESDTTERLSTRAFFLVVVVGFQIFPLAHPILYQGNSDDKVTLLLCKHI